VVEPPFVRNSVDTTKLLDCL